jgi:hypothetical protein
MTHLPAGLPPGWSWVEAADAAHDAPSGRAGGSASATRRPGPVGSARRASRVVAPDRGGSMVQVGAPMSVEGASATSAHSSQPGCAKVPGPSGAPGRASRVGAPDRGGSMGQVGAPMSVVGSWARCARSRRSGCSTVPGPSGAPGALRAWGRLTAEVRWCRWVLRCRSSIVGHVRSLPPARLLDGPGPVGSARRASRVGAPDRGGSMVQAGALMPVLGSSAQRSPTTPMMHLPAGLRPAGRASRPLMAPMTHLPAGLRPAGRASRPPTTPMTHVPAANRASRCEDANGMAERLPVGLPSAARLMKQKVWSWC